MYIIFGLTPQFSTTPEKAAAVPFTEQMNNGLAKRKDSFAHQETGTFQSLLQ